MSNRPRRPVATYSIVARDRTGSLGVAVQSHWFNVGAVVPWVDPAAGAVAVQSISDPGTGRGALEALRRGDGPDDALRQLLDGDAEATYRQIAMVDRTGRVAVHTGESCIAEAGHLAGDGYSVQANLMGSRNVWPAMAAAFERSGGDLVDRLLAALTAAEAAGGDVRGRQSAALVVAPGDGTDDRFDLRVEDARDPIGELVRLVRLQRAYLKLNRGDALMSLGQFEGALAAYEVAAGMIPDDATDGEAPFWVGVAFASAGRVDQALGYLRRAAAFGDRWGTLLPRLVRSNMLPDDTALIEKLTEALTR